MEFQQLLRAQDGRILGMRFCADGIKFALCQSSADGSLRLLPNTETVTVARGTRRWIGHALFSLSWHAEDLESVRNLMRDPRLEVPLGHNARNRALRLPDRVMPQDGYRQLASVWFLDGERFAACISDDALDPNWWGEQIANLMEQITFLTVARRDDQKQVLGTIFSGCKQSLISAEARRHFASRFDWSEAQNCVEIISIWASPNANIIRVTSNDFLGEDYFWGVACAALIDEAVETICVELEEYKQEIVNKLMSSFNARLMQAASMLEKSPTVVQ